MRRRHLVKKRSTPRRRRKPYHVKVRTVQSFKFKKKYSISKKQASITSCRFIIDEKALSLSFELKVSREEEIWTMTRTEAEIESLVKSLRSVAAFDTLCDYESVSKKVHILFDTDKRIQFLNNMLIFMLKRTRLASLANPHFCAARISTASRRRF